MIAPSSSSRPLRVPRYSASIRATQAAGRWGLSPVRPRVTAALSANVRYQFRIDGLDRDWSSPAAAAGC